MAEAGLLAPGAVHAVLTAAGQPSVAQAAGGSHGTRDRPAGLSDRECEVLGLLARGRATMQVARRLGISPKTCGHHIPRLSARPVCPPGPTRPCSRWNMDWCASIRHSPLDGAHAYQICQCLWD